MFDALERRSFSPVQQPTFRITYILIYDTFTSNWLAHSDARATAATSASSVQFYDLLCIDRIGDRTRDALRSPPPPSFAGVRQK